MYEFPKRTVESDLRAFLVKRGLDAISAPQNYMVCVVTTVGGGVAVACSGSGDSRIMLDVANIAHWQEQLKSMELKKSKRDNVRKIIKKFEAMIESKKVLTRGDSKKFRDAKEQLFVNDHQLPKIKPTLAAHGPASLIKAADRNAEMAERLVAPIKLKPDPTKLDAEPINLKEIGIILDVSSDFGRRDCAEPRALELAAQTGRRITGMTTIWYGNVARNDYVDELKLADVNFSAALPCEWCQSNEARIMMHVTDKIAETNPQRPNLQRRHSMPNIRA